jgi:hypothetical protein
LFEIGVQRRGALAAHLLPRDLNARRLSGTSSKRANDELDSSHHQHEHLDVRLHWLRRCQRVVNRLSTANIVIWLLPLLKEGLFRPSPVDRISSQGDIARLAKSHDSKLFCKSYPLNGRPSPGRGFKTTHHLLRPAASYCLSEGEQTDFGLL